MSTTAILLSYAVLVLASVHEGNTQIVNGGTLSQVATMAAESAVLTINVDNEFSLYWNGELTKPVNNWPQTNVYRLVPVPKCNYPNVLAINATDYGVVAGVIMQLQYAGITYKMGSSPEILLTNAYSSDPAWYMKPYSDPAVWASSNTLASCQNIMVAQELRIQAAYYQSGTSWRWFRSCNDVNKSIFVKLVVNTKLSCCCD